MERIDYSQWAPGWQKCLQDFVLSLAPGSRAVYRNTLERFFQTQEIPSPELATEQNVADFLNGFCAPGHRNEGALHKAGTHNSMLAEIRSFYRYATKHRVFTGDDPTLAFESKPVKANPKGFTSSQLDALITAIDADFDTHPAMKKRDKSLFVFLAVCGRRVSEARNMKVSDISKEMELLTDENGRSHMGYTYSFTPLKQKIQEVERVELSPKVRTMIFDWLACRSRLKDDMPLWTAIGNLSPDGRVDLSLTPYTPISTGAVNRRLKRYAAIAGIPGDPGSHILRHTSAQIRFTSGMTIWEVRNTLKHKSVLTTQKYLENLCNPTDRGIDILETQWQFLH